jgi:predicted RNA-binding protein with PIN domain
MPEGSSAKSVGRDILVDGYNVIKRAPSFQATRVQSLAAAREQLLVLLRNRYRHTPHQVIVIFDGDTDREQIYHEQRIRVVYSRRGETADAVIARLSVEARQAGREVEIYSDDTEVQRTVTLQGGTAQSTGQLERQVHAAPRDIERRARHRMAMRRKYGLDAPSIEKDEEPAHVQGKKKKKRR